MKKFLLVSTAMALISTGAYAQQVPLIQWSKERPEWKKDLSEVAYVGARCGSIDYVTGYYFSQEGNKPEDVANGKRFVEIGHTYTSVSQQLARILGMSDKFLYERHEALAKWYSMNLAENKKLHNEIFVGDFKSDFDFCVQQYQLYKALDEQLSTQSKKADKRKS